MAVVEKDYRLRNVLSLRKKMTSKDVALEIIKLRKFLKDNGIKKTGSITTVTFSIEMQNGVPFIDMEILVPLPNRVIVSGEYVFKPIFHMVNAVCISKSEHETSRIRNLLCWNIYDKLIRNKQQQDFLPA
ncbi:hypothetical protein [Ruminiclostridium cellulolyticum]|uniref:Uncharacterized protein n=1 Tax=Ruminiclostridium cellulolyticum (strain ATCC 35319 / DSM 5812 / JCM 6584 / H10) TaxID=394503 RepID=B8I4V1_RUMCH|nr:hypothetical protein [Ruminiclostridium cellulolyticum]ACL76605.1 hypothetical protein Ccel_2266 [Ruminiclostridium cellulolyticum H10]